MDQPAIHPAAEVLPLLPEPELKKLARDIRRRGQVQPILLYRGMILDGRNRFRACQLAGVEPHFRMVDPDLDGRGITPLEYVVSLNLRRRHLSPSQQAMAAAISLPQWTSAARVVSAKNLRRGAKAPERAKVHARGRSDQGLAKLFGVSPRYISLAAALRKQAPALAEEVAQGECTLSRATRRLREMERAARQEVEMARIRKHDTRLEVRQADIRRLPRQARRYALILTDPPYAEKDLCLWDSLAELAGEALVPGGYLAAVSGLQFLNESLARLANPKWGLKYYWTVCLSFSGPHGRRHRHRLVTTWRPVLVFFKPPYHPPRRQIIDRFTAKLPSIQEHRWQQHADAFSPLVQNFSGVGDSVLDPFAGSGAVLEACRGLGRNALGLDNDPAAVELIRRRLGLRRS